MIVPSIVAGWFLIFMPSFYELTMSNLLYSNNTKTLGVELFIYQTFRIGDRIGLEIKEFLVLPHEERD